MISIIIPLFNKEKSIIRTIESVLLQSYEDFEIVIVNDGSNDNSISLIRDINDERIKIYHQINSGVSAARNTGINKSLGEWLLFLDADDILLPNCLQTLVDLITNFNVKIAAANYYTFDLKGKKYKYINSFKSGIITNLHKNFFLKNFYLRMGNSLFHKSVFNDLKFNTNLKRYEDYELFFKIYNSVISIAISQKPVMIYTHDYGSLALDFSKLEGDYINYLNFEQSTFWEKMNLSLLYSQGENIYSDKRLSEKYKEYISYKFIAEFIVFWLKGYRKFLRFSFDYFRKIS